METARIIVKVETGMGMEWDGSSMEWVNSLGVVERPNGHLRLRLEPRDLNKVLTREHYQLPTFEEISQRLTGASYFKM